MQAVRDFRADDIPHVISYLYDSPPQFLRDMGIEPSAVPPKEKLTAQYEQNISQSDREKTFCPLVWELDGEAIGFSTLKRISFGHTADVHLHIWHPEHRRKGLGHIYFPHCVRQFFRRFELERIFCEPSSGNAGSNRVMQKVGFTLEKTYRTVPSEICYEIEVNRYVIEPKTAELACERYPLQCE